MTGRGCVGRMECGGGRRSVGRVGMFALIVVVLFVPTPDVWAQDAVPPGAALQARSAGALSAAEVHSAASNAFDATYYHLTLDLHFGPDRFIGRTLVQGRVAVGTLDTLVLDLDDRVQVRSVESPAGDSLPFIHNENALYIDLPDHAPAGDVAVVVYYEGTPNETGDRAFQMGVRGDGTRFAWTLSEPYGARQWWPSKDHPSDKADSVRVTVTVPEPMTAVSNGLQRVPPASAGGRVTYDWFSRYPISTYLVSIAAGVYEYHEQTYARPDSLAAAFGPLTLPVVHYEYADTVSFFEGVGGISGWKHVLRMFPVFEHWFGPYPFPEEKYGHAQFTWGGGMEHQTISSMGGSTITLIAHELAHQWFGDLITLETWPHLWLNEGFATYAELLYYEADGDFYGNDPFRQIFNVEYSRSRGAEGTLVVQDTTSFSSLFNTSRVYAKGGIVLHMLRHVVGDEPFRQILRAYVAEPALRYGTATTADFHAIAEAVSGEDLDYFFRQWVTEGTGYPAYEVVWTARPTDAGYEVVVDLAQTQDLPVSNVSVFEMPVTLEVRSADAAARFRVHNDQREQQFRFEVPFEPTDLAFDPDRQILRRVNVQSVGVPQGPERPSAPRILAVYPQPASDYLEVRVVEVRQATATVTLYDALGRRVGQQPLAAGQTALTIDLTMAGSGLYFLRFTTPDGEDVRPVVVAR